MTNPYMEIAIQEARMAAEEGEIPVGAVIVKGNIVISRAHNLREKMGSATAHAEILAIDEACRILGRWRLDDCDLYVTLEPCPMCPGLSSTRASGASISAQPTRRPEPWVRLWIFCACALSTIPRRFTRVSWKANAESCSQIFKPLR